MEREILFRGKRLDNKEWVYGGIAYKGNRAFIVTIIEYRPETRDWHIAEYYEKNPLLKAEMIEVDPDTVGQYTGMPDKNGTKIFSGDLLKYTGYEDDSLYRVLWKNTGWYIQYRNRQPESLGISLPEDWVVGGNIYDNPELLKEKK